MKKLFGKIWNKLKQWGREWVKKERNNLKQIYHCLITILLSLLMIVLRLLWALCPITIPLFVMIRENIYIRIMSLNLSILFKVK